MIRRHKRWDAIFGLGLLAMMVGVFTLAGAVRRHGDRRLPRLSAEFFTNFPSRRAGEAGILSAWVGSIW